MEIVLGDFPQVELSGNEKQDCLKVIGKAHGLCRTIPLCPKVRVSTLLGFRFMVVHLPFILQELANFLNAHNL